MKNAKYMTPSAATPPFDPQRQCDRQQQQESDAKSEHAERERIARADRKPGGATRHAAQRARRDRRENADIFVAGSSHARSAETVYDRRSTGRPRRACHEVADTIAI